ncbi:uncharacterized protein [Solanum tuberosum]|uniref:uncharacterized protein n=1 Tax=Solanum tuberosum TaxID=4113 RepID=UPI00073A03C8|nr:PREDICTED: uncharacterized protein LOC107061701 [Solanum tuberosum]
MNGHQNEEDPALKKQMPLNLSKVQYEQLLNILGTLQIGNGNSNSDNSDNMMSGAVNLAAEATSSSHFYADPTSVRIDFASPLYLRPSESAGSSLLPAVFDGTVKSKTEFINGTIVRPALVDPGFLQWERCDDMVTSWILNSLSPDLRDSLQYVNNAHELWAELEERYDQTNGCKLYQL